MNFFQKLLSGSDEVSSKRLISLYALVLLTAIIIDIHFGASYSDGVVVAVAGLILGSSAITVLNKPKEPNYKEDNKY